MTILVTGAAGFIGSNFVLDWLGQSAEEVVSLDLLTYAGNLENLSSLDSNSHHHFVQAPSAANRVARDMHQVRQAMPSDLPNKYRATFQVNLARRV